MIGIYRWAVMQGIMPVKTKTRVTENMGVNGGLVDARAKQVLREAVDAVVNSFAKHTQGYGRGKSEKSEARKLRWSFW